MDAGNGKDASQEEGQRVELSHDQCSGLLTAYALALTSPAGVLIKPYGLVQYMGTQNVDIVSIQFMYVAATYRFLENTEMTMANG